MEKEESFNHADHNKEQTEPTTLADTVAEAQEDLSGRENIMPVTAEIQEEQREQQPEKVEEPVFRAEHDEEQPEPESLTEAVSECEESKEPSHSTVNAHDEIAAMLRPHLFKKNKRKFNRKSLPYLLTKHMSL